MTKTGPILWAEDSPEDQILIREALGDKGSARVTFASDGVHLLAELGKATPALVVLDLKMPRMGGLETLRRIRAAPQWRDLRVCIFSAGDLPAEIAECQALGALEVARKPVDFRQFTATVRRVVSHAT